MVNLLDKLLDFCSSLKLAIFLILSLAFYLAAATFYEARYGTRAVQDMIYGSQPFILLMAMLSINVMAAVLVRYPWKRKQTGFIITHIGIETLLLGCLISFRFSVDGKVSLTPQQSSEVINLNDEEVRITMADAGGVQRSRHVPISLWKDAGYPGLARFVAGRTVDIADGFLWDMSPDLGKSFASLTKPLALPQEMRWPEGHTVAWPLGSGVKLTVLDWQPSAVGETVIKGTPDGYPCAMVHLGGSMPNGMPADQDIPLVVDDQGYSVNRPNGGLVELSMWKARSDAEVQEFLHPPARASLPEMGQLAIYVDGKRYAVNVTKEVMNQDQPLADSGYKVKVTDYTLSPPPPKLPEGHGEAAMASTKIDPQLQFEVIGPQGTKQYILRAWMPSFLAVVENGEAARHGAAAASDPLMYYWHPQAYFTARGDTLGRLQLLQSPEGHLYAHMYELANNPDQAPLDPFEVQIGKAFAHKWLTISLTVTQYAPSGTIATEFRPAHVEARQMDDHTRAIRVALEVDGNRQEAWLALGDGPTILNTPRGSAEIDYGYREFELGFGIGLNHAEQTNDPGSDSPATYTSDVTIKDSGPADGPHTITMNEPVTVKGLTFYQAGFVNDEVPMSTLSVRRDPGWVIKYLGCALIVGGIFTMFYMKAYFQKTPAAAAAAKAATNKNNGRPMAGAVKGRPVKTS